MVRESRLYFDVRGECGGKAALIGYEVRVDPRLGHLCDLSSTKISDEFAKSERKIFLDLSPRSSALKFQRKLR